MWPPTPISGRLARVTATAAFQRMSARMRRSTSSSPGNSGLALGRDRVDVVGAAQRRQADLPLPARSVRRSMR
jgi:hypothetical protein